MTSTRVVIEALAFLRHEFERSQVSVQLELGTDPIPVLIDRIQLQQVLINLSMNALEAMQSITGGPRNLLIRTQHDGAQAQVTVIDSGIGVPQQHIKRMFEAFFTTKSSGMGMGLSICRSIIEAHGGRIRASSAGTRRHHPRIPFTFARGAIAVTATPRKPGDGKDREEPVVLVIDDDESMREALKSLFRSVGLRAEVFGSAAELMRRALPDVPSCLVLDVRLPELSGLDFQAELLAAGIHMPVIFITGHGDIPMTVQAMKAGAVDFLTKPFRQQEMIHAVARAPGHGQKAAQRCGGGLGAAGTLRIVDPPRAGDHGVRERGDAQ